RTRPRRPKSMQACASCRRHKTRCELLDVADDEPTKCHRCRVLGIDCSYEGMDMSILAPKDSPPSSHTNAGVEDPAGRTGLDTLAAASERSPRLLDRAMGGTLKGHDLPFTRATPHGPKILTVDRWWSFVKPNPDLDWSAPMLCVQQLSRPPPLLDAAQQIPPPPDASCLADILNRDQISHLLNVFAVQYLPWLNFTPMVGFDTPLLDLARCTVASRHLDTATRAVVCPRLQKLAEDTISKVIFNPHPGESIESIQALIILSLWAPLSSEPSSQTRDARLLTGSLVSMALNLRLDQASGSAIALRAIEESTGYPNSQDNIGILVDNVRLWMALANTESLLCIGTGRMPLSRRSPADHEILSRAGLDDVESGRDYRLILLGELFDAVERGSCIQFENPESLDDWYCNVESVWAVFGRLTRLIIPLAVVADHETFYFQMMQIYVNGCQLIFLYHTLFEARYIYRDSPAPNVMRTVRSCGVLVFPALGRKCVAMAEAVLTSVLLADVALLGTAPDNIFTLISLAAGLVLQTKSWAVYNVGKELSGSGTRLLNKTIAHLSQAAYTADHPARRCSQLISLMVDGWERGFAKYTGRIPKKPPADALSSTSAAPGSMTANTPGDSSLS
ncbi:hypothetical protein FISHEDRAFT_26133, partial [Fistulina hepatica ATCC 64428]